MNELYWVWVQKSLGVGSKAMAGIAALMRHFGLTVEDIYNMDKSQLASYGYLSNRALERLSNKSLTEARKTCNLCQDHGMDILCFDDPRYPDRLRNIFDPPAVLYYRGQLPDFCASPCFGIVGTRRASTHGIACAQELAQRLCAASDCVIVSGGAAGIDKAAHRGAMMAKGATVAVLGCAVDSEYYPSGRGTRKTIERTGAAVSEFSPGTPVTTYNFPIRNRIISGLSLCVAVIEGAAKSGSIITANLAAEQGRDVFAMPGYVSLANSGAANTLLRDGANVLITPNDILKMYKPLYPEHITLEKRETPLGAAGFSDVEIPQGVIEEDIALNEEREKRRSSSSRSRSGAKAAKSAKSEKSEKPADEKTEKKAAPAAAKRDISDELTGNAHIIYKALGNNEMSSEELAEATGVELSGVLVCLTELELTGAVVSLPGMRYKRT